MKVVFNNYPDLRKVIIWKDGKYQLIEDSGLSTQGIAGITENNNFVGIFVNSKKAFFVFENQVYSLSTTEFECNNTYINKDERCFILKNKGVEICKIIYKPFVDSGMIFYEVDLEEFDILLFLSDNFLNSTESLELFISSK
ncbi:hypothetical protein SH1V18_18580 [Vallitalea longa]|uniref:Uncharacterized protein n=1 Tax=Vallitalea longa TaxID=2936439 RepID=A0A9W5YBL9_9FIRM|nr:hypothetical protein [Vallitalea longa]GKX29378.1 hypothetical protein SH1V18_18580 [Vallitalea longa]